jgi:hypothetical protein
MNITFNALREIKHRLPTGSISFIAKKLNTTEQAVRNYFGATKYEDGNYIGIHLEPGPEGGIVCLEDTAILDLAKQLIAHATRN